MRLRERERKRLLKIRNADLFVDKDDVYMSTSRALVSLFSLFLYLI